VLRTERVRGEATNVAEKASSTFFTVVGVAALAIAVGAALPAEAKKRSGAPKPAEEAILDPANGEPMTLVVSLSNQKVDIYRGTTLITSSKVSTGMRGHATKAGVFSILEKRRYHHSNIYSGAPMPWMQRLTWSGTALHAGVVPGYPASHGCIRLPFSFAPKLFAITDVGRHVVVARDSVAPQMIEHANLFQPLPPPEAPAMVRQDHPPQRQSSIDAAPVESEGAALPVVLAKADVGGVTLDRTPAIEAAAFESSTPRDHATMSGLRTAEVAPADPAVPGASDPVALEDTHAHAVDPFAGASTQAGHAGLTAAAASANGHALDEEGGPSGELGTVSAAALDRAPIEAPEPAGTEAPAAPVVAVAPAEAETPMVATSPVEPANVPAPADSSAVVQAVAAAPATSMDEPSAQSAPDVPPSVIALKLGAGTKAAAIMAAEPRSTAPLRILVTRRTQRDRIIGVQQILADMGYLMPQDFDGTLGRASVTAMKAFQKANEMPETGAFTDEFVAKVYAVAGKGEPPAGHLFVRQEFGRVFDAPVSFRDPEKPLGTHLFTAMHFAPGDTRAQWMAISVQGDEPADALDRLEIPDDLRQKISERLTPGSSLIVGDTAINSATLPKGADFLVWAKDTPAKITAASVNGDLSEPAPKRKKKSRTVRRPNSNYTFSYPTQRGFRSYPQWPW
jgi:peptidoglycan hydrolase-like protein with peptidoglycan-binding domain